MKRTNEQLRQVTDVPILLLIIRQENDRRQNTRTLPVQNVIGVARD